MAEDNMKEPENNELGTAPIPGLLTKTSLPLVASLLVSVLYGLIDNIYVSRIGESALTAMSFATPVQGVIAGVSAGMAVGVNAVVSRKLGQKDDKEVTKGKVVCGYGKP